MATKSVTIHIPGFFIWGILFYFCWNAVAPCYFEDLPAKWQHIPFWHCIGFFVLIGIANGVIKAILR